MMARARTPIADRFAAKSRRDGDCIIWTGVKDRYGYGKMVIGRREYRAHRVAFLHANGLESMPAHIFVCHACDRRDCVNPAHLFAGTARDNTSDMIAKGRKAKVVDLDHPNTKISHADRKKVRALRADGWTLTEIAKQFGVCFQTISEICRMEGCYGAA